MKAMSTSEKVRQARTMRMLSQERLAELTHTSRASVAGYEVGRVKPPDDWVQAVAYVTDIDEAWFFDPTDTLPPINSLTEYEPRQSPPRGFEVGGQALIEQPFAVSVHGVILQGTIRFQITIDKVVSA